MTIYKTEQGEQLLRARYLEILQHWPVVNEHMRIPTRAGETFIIASGTPSAPPLLLFHGGMANSCTWMGDIDTWAPHFRVYAADIIGEPGLSAPSRLAVDSEEHALWIDDILDGLSLEQASLVGISLGGWLSLDYAIRRPSRVLSLAVMCPAGVGRQKLEFYLKALLLLLLGKWGQDRLRSMVFGGEPADLRPEYQAFTAYTALIQKHFVPRKVKFNPFSDAQLRILTMPLLAIVGARDVLFDSVETRDRLQACAAQARVVFLEDQGHIIRDQTSTILDFLMDSIKSRNARGARSILELNRCPRV